MRAVRVGLGAVLGVPDQPFLAFGLAGALGPGLPPGSLLTTSRVVDEEGRTLWEGEPVDVAGAQWALLCAMDRIVDDPSERRTLAARTGAVAVDMESRSLAATGNLAGIIRAISDSPDRPLGRLAFAVKPDGRTAARAALGSFALEPIESLRTTLAARRGLASLERAAVALAGRGR